MGLFSIFSLPKDQPIIKDKKVIKREYLYWRLRVFMGMYVGYALYYFTRKSFSFLVPALKADLGFTTSQMGLVASVLPVVYGISKFVSGVLGDRLNPRAIMGVGLLLTGVFNLLFGMSSSIAVFMVFWGLNGWFQGFGWPPCARLLTHWYSQSERGRWWSLWNTSHNVGGAIIPFLVGIVAQYYGWRMAMFVPGAICILGGLFLMKCLTDTPKSHGLPSIEEYRKDLPPDQAKEAEKKLTTKEILVQYVLTNGYVWLLAISSFFVYVIRQSVNDWSNLFLVESRHYTLAIANTCLVWFEVGGFFGSLSAGWLSDTVFGSRRGPINVLFSLGAILGVMGFYFVPAGWVPLDCFMVFFIGFAIFGPQMMIGMAAAELSHKNAAATATGFTGWISYLGAAFAGWPMTKIAEVYGWQGFFTALGVCGGVAVILLLPLWSVKINTKFTD